MKYFFLLITIAHLSFYTPKKLKQLRCIAESHIEGLNLKGKVKSVEYTSKYTKVGRLSGGSSMLDNVCYFDEYGEIFEQFFFDEKGEIVFERKTSMNEMGCPCEIKNRNYKTDSLSFTTKIAYNYKNLTIENHYFNSNVSLTRSSINQYDSLGNILEIKHLDYKNELTGLVKYFYNEKNEFVKWIRYDNQNKQTGDYTFTYNVENRTTEIVINDKELPNTVTSIALVNSNKDIIENKSDGNTYKYNYDKMGNWIKKRWFRNGKTLKIERKNIKYY